MKDLIETDGENRAVRGFLLGREVGVKTFADMRQHLTNYGAPYWPEHLNVAQGHITKAEQQEWLRHLFSLEPPQAEAVPQQPECYKWDEYRNWAWGWGWSDRETPYDPRLPENAQYHQGINFSDPESVRNFRALYTAPQQAEAVPSDVVRDAERLDWLIDGAGRRIAIDSFGGQYRIVDPTASLVVTDWYATKREAIDAAMTQGEKP